MGDDCKPFYGPMQPTYGLRLDLPYSPMKGDTKRPKIVSAEIRKIAGDNIRMAINKKFDTVGDRMKAAAELVGVTKSTMQRITEGKVGMSIDTLWAVAVKLQVAPFRLLMDAEDRRCLIDARQIVREGQPEPKDDKSPRRRIA